MTSTTNLPFGVNSVVPELKNVPKPRIIEKAENIAPAFLRLSEDSREAMALHLENVGIDRRRFSYSVKSQQEALELYATLHLYIPSQDERDVQTKYSIQKTSSKAIGKNKARPLKRQTRHFQCQCGVDNEEGRFASKKRQIPWKNVGCLSWIKLVTTHGESNDGQLIAIDEISGVFDHSEGCTSQLEMERNPRVPLNLELREYALSLLRKNAPLSLLRSECSDYAEKKWPGHTGDNNARYKLTTHDTSSLYRTISQERGVPQRTAAEENLDKWFRTERALPPSSLLPESCLHYQAHEKPKTDRFEIILSTPEMRTAAWKYGHKKQVLMDLTFGVCSARALLAILMALDDTGKGIPICFILFTARESAKATHADYDSALLTRLLNLFRAGMGQNALGELFDIRIGSTDNDVRERSALTTNWGSIFLLLCIFHVWQAWRNALNRHLRSVSKGDARQLVRKRIGQLLIKLLKDTGISNHGQAMHLYTEEITHWKTVERKRNKLSKSQATAALGFLEYLRSYIENEACWLPWSPAGAAEAARRLEVPYSRIARTTNPLESFNGRIKGKYYKPYQHSGRLPRIDVWILLLVTAVIPDFFKERREKQQLNDYYQMMRKIVPQISSPQSTESEHPPSPPNILTPVLTAQVDNASVKRSYHDELIEKWLEELEFDEELDAEELDAKEPQKHTVENRSNEPSESVNDYKGHHEHATAMDTAEPEHEPVKNTEEFEEMSTKNHHTFETMENNYEHDVKGKERHDPASPSEKSFISESVGSFDGVLGIHFNRGRRESLEVQHEHHAFYTPRHPHASSSSSIDVIPDSAIASDWEPVSDSSSCESPTSTTSILDENYAPPCQSHSRHTTLLVVPNSTSPTTERDFSRINAIGTATMRLRAAEDEMLNQIQILLDLSPESASQIEHYMSPSIRERLKTGSSRSYTTESPSECPQNQGQESLNEGQIGLVPFTMGKKEARKESYRIR